MVSKSSLGQTSFRQHTTVCGGPRGDCNYQLGSLNNFSAAGSCVCHEPYTGWDCMYRCVAI